MTKVKREKVHKTTRLAVDISEALGAYAEDEFLSMNAALNQLLKEILIRKKYLKKKIN